MRKSTKSKTVPNPNKAQILVQEAIFFEKFSELVGADVPLLRALEIAATFLRDQNLQSLLLQMIPRLEQGLSLTDAFRQHPDYFSLFHLAIIESAENDGHLEDGFLQVAESMRHEAETMETNGVPEGLSISSSTIHTPVDSLSQISRELSVISSHLAQVSQQLSHLSRHSASSNHKKGKRER